MNRWIALLVLLLVPATVFAHGGAEDVRGVLASSSGTQLGVTTPEGLVRLVAIEPTTRFERDGKPAKLIDLPIGARLVVHLAAGRTPAVAALVKFGAAPPIAPVKIAVTVTSAGFVLEAAPTLRRDQPVTFIVTRKVEKTCAKDFVVRELGVSAPLPLDVPVEVTITPTKAGKLHFSCAMDMLGGDLVVE